MKKNETIECRAKINLSLDVIGQRPDGYHNLEMLMQEVALCDILNITADTESEGIEIFCADPHVPCNSDNLAAKAALAYLAAAEIQAGVKISIEKHIPMGAGLGGGSSDAAGVLSALNAVFGNRLAFDRLSEIAASLGSDVPFFLHGGCMLAAGIGTELKRIPSLSRSLHILIAKPDIHVSTPHVYKSLRLDEKTVHPDTRGAISALENGDIEALARCCANVLETVTAAEYEEINEYKAIMSDFDAVYSLMSGSGSSVFGIFNEKKAAERAAESFRLRTSEVFLTKAAEQC